MTPSPIDQFRREYQEYHRITPTRANEQRRVIQELESRLNGRSWAEAKAADFQTFLGDLLASGLHVNTVRKKANMVRPFFGWLYARDLIDADTYLKLKSVKDPRGATGRSTPKPYSRKELDDFYAALVRRLPLLPEKGPGSLLLKRWLVGKSRWSASQWSNGVRYTIPRHAMRLQVEAIVALALHCGLRREEIFRLSPDDLHYDNDYIVVTGKADPNTGRPQVREVPFTEAARKAVRLWLDFRLLLRPEGQNAESTWLSCYGAAYNHAMPLDRLSELLPAVVGKGWTLHRFRHTFATERLRAGTSLEIVSEALGHATLAQTMAYAEIVQADIARELAKTEEVFTERVANRAA